MARRKRPEVKRILADPDLRRKLMVSTIQATQAREGIETTEEQADRAYYVVTEGERAAFFDLQKYRSRKEEPDKRHERFARALRGEVEGVRFDVARRDFRTVEEAPLAYSRLRHIANFFRDYPALGNLAEMWQGVITRDDERFMRFFWEVLPNREIRPWVTLHKGGQYSRFYFDADLVIDWSLQAQNEFHRLRDKSIYFKPGLTWPRRTAKGINVRRLPADCVFSDKGPAMFLGDKKMEDYILAITNSVLFEYIFTCKTSFSWEIGIMKSMPVPVPIGSKQSRIARFANDLHDAKGTWDEGNEVSTRFVKPWLLHSGMIDPNAPVNQRLVNLSQFEAAEDVRIRELYAQLNDEVYRLYGIPESSMKVIEETLGERPSEIIWPQMEGKTAEQKRMEHVWRLLSYTVKRVVDDDEDGIVPFLSVAGETSLLDRVHLELEELFHDHSVSQVEVDIVNELKRKVKGYRSVKSIQEWIDDVFFQYHVSLYKKRPIIWHVSSNQGRGVAAFGALVHYHKFDKNGMAKLRGAYLREAIELFRREAALAAQERREADRLEWQAKLEETEELDRRLQLIQEGYHEGPEGSEKDFRILTPWKSADKRPKGWDPDLDDGVKVNIEPLQNASVLRVAKVI